MYLLKFFFFVSCKKYKKMLDRVYFILILKNFCLLRIKNIYFFCVDIEIRIIDSVVRNEIFLLVKVCIKLL